VQSFPRKTDENRGLLAGRERERFRNEHVGLTKVGGAIQVRFLEHTIPRLLFAVD